MDDSVAKVDFVDDQSSDTREDTPGVDVEAQAPAKSPTTRIRGHTLRSLIHGHNENHHHDAPQSPDYRHLNRTETAASKYSVTSLRHRGRVETSIAYGAEEMGRSTGWQPGLEPGIDTSDPPAYKRSDPEDHMQDVRHLEQLHQKCEITVVDYSSEQMNSQYLDNENLTEFLADPQEDWVQVRWINVNGLSWDVIKELGNYKSLHRLAIEDLMNTRNRTKADWYSDHTFIVLPLQKLVNIENEHDSDSDDNEAEVGDLSHDYDPVTGMKRSESQTRLDHEQKRRAHAEKHMKKHNGAIKSLIRDIMRPKKRRNPYPPALNKSSSFKNASKIAAPWVPKKIQTLQQYHAGPNQDRIEFMQRHSTLGKRGLGVSMEQVSVFLTADNTVISFFEYSAQDVEIPIMKRLQSKSTILRQSCDASMLMQSILDTIIDLAIPVTTAYQDAIGDLELDVLTDPQIGESTALYILTSEIAVLRGAIAPVNQLISSLRYHKTTVSALTIPSRAVTPSIASAMAANNTRQLHHSPATPEERPKLPYGLRAQRSEVVSAGVTISELTQTYLGDVEDHAQIIQDAYDQMRRNADNLVDLIFNTVGAFQNESMRQLTVITAFFLPLTFMVGYFGMNFKDFDGVQKHSDAFFWYIATPVCFVVLVLLLRDWIARWFTKSANKMLINRGRKRRLEMAAR